MKIGVISDSHFKDKLGYSDYFSDGREAERQAVLEAVEHAFKDCSVIVFNGDNLDKKNNSSETIRAFTEFLMRFKDKTVVVNGGNHEKMGDGSSALDFLQELGLDHLSVVTKKPQYAVWKSPVSPSSNVSYTVCPYFSLAELGVETVEEGSKKVMEMLPGGDILFVHHAIGGTKTISGIPTDLFHEIVLPKEELEKKYKLVIGGHIHAPQQNGQTYVVGCTFSNEVGDVMKRVLTIEGFDLKVTSHELPVRPIVKVDNPMPEDLLKLSKESIVKVVLTHKYDEMDILNLKEQLSHFPAHVLIEQVPDERRKLHFEDGVLDFSVDNLLNTYAVERKVDVEKLKYAISLL